MHIKKILETVKSKSILAIAVAISLSTVVAFAGFKTIRNNREVSLKKNNEVSKELSTSKPIIPYEDKKTAKDVKVLKQQEKEEKQVSKINEQKNVQATNKVKKNLNNKDLNRTNVYKATEKQYQSKIVQPLKSETLELESCELQPTGDKVTDIKTIEQKSPTNSTSTKTPTPTPTSTWTPTPKQKNPAQSVETVKEKSSDNVDISGLEPLPTKYNISVSGSQEQIILNLLNSKRRQAGLKELVMDNTLLKVARYKSNHMIQYDYFNHSTPKGELWYDWLRKIGYKYSGTGENIAYNYSGGEQLFNQWWNSQGHRDNMMNPSYTKIGIGVVYNKDKGVYMGTQTFAN
ncbi:Uncharacterized conserved protein YkwD, contains CAP (CSP/antigen 5/PR1) domain [Hathewaya proteolytica DSM 3090]|uniref:Uncharacterized conserved protein YkwD, contains CAP (CSP/antigen 5/PR1) domain n=1 Tax=Hathewaya proteolytica DSM 3090 TaxID=1121331 RepID=A0A1M6K2T7_9CLOT|nr:CAP domain-containing protein [Hathewaya proteolytica]SHJ53214.1 Uncharacterized conserved protein YkwD, contains CAP (CSP/antigen 5/PR1) domain [Hathewaya proteolytica DSM 3090]